MDGVDFLEISGYVPKESIKDVATGDNLTEEQRAESMDLAKQFQSLFTEALGTISDSCLHSEELLKFEGYDRCTDNRFISELFANGDIKGNSQTAKQMKDLHFKYEIAL